MCVYQTAEMETAHLGHFQLILAVERGSTVCVHEFMSPVL